MHVAKDSQRKLQQLVNMGQAFARVSKVEVSFEIQGQLLSYPAYLYALEKLRSHGPRGFDIAYRACRRLEL